MSKPSPPSCLILASTSAYRKMLLQRLRVPFTCQPPELDETPDIGEPAIELVRRLAMQKASAVASRHPNAAVIGADQVVVYGGRVIGKPGGHLAALEQLTNFSSNEVEFLTAVSVQHQDGGFADLHTDCTRVVFRALQKDEIERYLAVDQPYNCAGAFKAESLGVTLFERVVSKDPTALIGLPLIRTSGMLRRLGMQIP